MEQHPIPQDVTGFQFKLIGDMTVKQFAYLAGGVVLAWIIFSLPLFWLIKYPLIFVFGMLGVALAFIPVEGRPFDVMLMNFLKALITPNQYIFQKMGHPLFPTVVVPKKTVVQNKEKQEAQHQSEQKLQKYLSGIHTTQKNVLDEKEMRLLGTLPLQAGVSAQPIQEMPHIAPQMPPPPQADDVPNEALEKEAAVLQQELAQAKAEEAQAVQKAAPNTMAAHEKVVQLEKELSDILGQKEKLQSQIVTLKKELAAQKQQLFTPGVVPTKQVTQNVRSIQQGQGKAAGLPIAPEAPNLLTGIIKDPRGNTIPNILIEVKDKDGNPVRAFKTNGLGQFAAATQLSDGVYTITFEDPSSRNKFDAVEISVTGVIISPLEIISVDERENLRKELFK